MRIIAFGTGTASVTRMLQPLGEPTRPPTRLLVDSTSGRLLDALVRRRKAGQCGLAPFSGLALGCGLVHGHGGPMRAFRASSSSR